MTFTYHNPVRIHFGSGLIQKIRDLVGNRRALLVADSSFERLGWAERLSGASASIVHIVDDVEPNPSIQYIQSVYEKLSHQEVDVIIAVGGGSVMDTAKALSVVDNGDGFDRLCNLIKGGPWDGCVLTPIIAVPTTAGTGSEVTPWATLWDPESGRKYSLSSDRLWCESCIVDPEFTYTLPRSVTIQGALDALSHSLESLWNRNANPISTEYAIGAARAVLEYLPRVLANPGDPEGREHLMLASLMAGLAFSNTQTAIAHAISYHLTMQKGIPHGIACSFALPDIVSIVAAEGWMNDTLTRIFGEPSNGKLRELYASCQAPTSLADFQVTPDEAESLIASITSTPRAGNSLVDVGKITEMLRGMVQ